MTNRSKIFYTIGLMATFLLIGGIPNADAAYISKIEPYEINNEHSNTIDIYGVDFDRDIKVFLSDIEIEDLEVISTNHMKGRVLPGLENGMHPMRLESEDNITIIPDALSVIGDNVELRVLNVREEAITGGIKYIVDFNTEAKVKLYTGPDSESMTVKIRKAYSKRHILPFVFPFDENYRYYLTQIEARDEKGNEVLLPLQVKRWTTNGVKTDAGDLDFSYPVLNFDFENNSASFTFEANKPIRLKVSKSIFNDGDIEMIEHEGQGQSLMDHYIELKDLIPDTLYYITLEGEARNQYGSSEKKKMSFEFYFADASFIGDEEIMSCSLSEEEGLIVEDEEMIEDEQEESDQSDKIDFSEFGKADSWAVPYVEALIDTGIVNGNNGKFDPNRWITRSEAATMLARAADLSIPENPVAYFTDVPKNHHVFPILSVFVDRDYDRGVGNGVFGLNEPIGRGDIVRMITKVMDLDTNEDVKKSYFEDVSSDDEYMPYIEKALEEGWISPNAKFRPNDKIKRIEAAKLIALAYGLVDTVEDDFEYVPLTEEDEEQAEEAALEDENEEEIIDETEVIENENEAEVITEEEEVIIDEEEGEESTGEDDILDDDISLEDLLEML